MTSHYRLPGVGGQGTDGSPSEATINKDRDSPEKRDNLFCTSYRLSTQNYCVFLITGGRGSLEKRDIVLCCPE